MSWKRPKSTASVKHQKSTFCDHDFGGTGEISSPVIPTVALTSFRQSERAGRLVFISQYSFSIPPSPHPGVKKRKNIYHLWNIYWMKWITGDLCFFISLIWGLSSLRCFKNHLHQVCRAATRCQGSEFALALFLLSYEYRREECRTDCGITNGDDLCLISKREHAVVRINICSWKRWLRVLVAAQASERRHPRGRKSMVTLPPSRRGTADVAKWLRKPWARWPPGTPAALSSPSVSQSRCV